MKFDVFRISASLATATLTVLASTACGTSGPAVAVVYPETVRHSELVGRWGGEQECGSPLPVIRLRDDYSFTIKDFPFEWDGPGEQVKRRSTDGKWHAVTKDPGLHPYLVLTFEKGEGTEVRFLTFTVDKGNLRMDGTVEAGGGDPYTYPCHYKRTSVDPEFGL